MPIFDLQIQKGEEMSRKIISCIKYTYSNNHHDDIPLTDRVTNNELYGWISSNHHIICDIFGSTSSESKRWKDLAEERMSSITVSIEANGVNLNRLFDIDLDYLQGAINILREYESRANYKLQHPDLLEETKKSSTKNKSIYIFLRLLLSFILATVGVYAIFILPNVVSWFWLLQHPKRLGLQISALVLLTGFCWLIIDKSKNRKSFIIGSIIAATVIGAIQLL